MWIDVHAHLADIPDLALNQVIEEATNAKLTAIVNAATDLKTSEHVIEQACAYSLLLPMVGISPFDTENLPHDWPDRLTHLANHEKVIGLGEIGLDQTNPAYPPQKLQLPVFEKQLELSIKKDMPVVIHSRGAEIYIAQSCLAHGVTRALFHCFTGEKNAARKILDAGYYISLSGIVTFKNSNLKEIIEYIPLDRLLIETDSPYLAPVPKRGKRNRPAWVLYTGEYIARLKKYQTDAFQEQLNQNFNDLFGLSTGR